MINLGTSINLHFRLNFLEGPNGYGIAPGMLSVASDAKCDDCTLATLCGGLREPDRNFWYPNRPKNMGLAARRFHQNLNEELVCQLSR